MVWLSLATRMAKGKARLPYYLLHKWKDQINDFTSKFTDKLELQELTDVSDGQTFNIMPSARASYPSTVTEE